MQNGIKGIIILNLIITELLDSISVQAKKIPRLQMNVNFHEELDAPSQRLLNALEPGTMIFECKDGPYAPIKGEDILR